MNDLEKSFRFVVAETDGYNKFVLAKGPSRGVKITPKLEAAMRQWFKNQKEIE